jgi:hypothetical protein
MTMSLEDIFLQLTRDEAPPPDNSEIEYEIENNETEN